MKNLAASGILFGATLLGVVGCSTGKERVVREPTDFAVVLPPDTRFVQVDPEMVAPSQLLPDRPLPAQKRSGVRTNTYQVGPTVSPENPNVIVGAHTKTRIEDAGGPRLQALTKAEDMGSAHPITREPVLINEEMAMQLAQSQQVLSEGIQEAREMATRTNELIMVANKLEAETSRMRKQSATLEALTKQMLQQVISEAEQTLPPVRPPKRPTSEVEQTLPPVRPTEPVFGPLPPNPPERRPQ